MHCNWINFSSIWSSCELFVSFEFDRFCFSFFLFFFSFENRFKKNIFFCDISIFFLFNITQFIFIKCWMNSFDNYVFGWKKNQIEQRRYNTNTKRKKIKRFKRVHRIRCTCNERHKENWFINLNAHRKREEKKYVKIPMIHKL